MDPRGLASRDLTRRRCITGLRYYECQGCAVLRGGALLLGFTELEESVYTYLAQKSSAIGYRVAQPIRKPVANTYKAIESLEEKRRGHDGPNRLSALAGEILPARLDEESKSGSLSPSLKRPSSHPPVGTAVCGTDHRFTRTLLCFGHQHLG